MSSFFGRKSKKDKEKDKTVRYNDPTNPDHVMNTYEPLEPKLKNQEPRADRKSQKKKKSKKKRGKSKRSKRKNKRTTQDVGFDETDFPPAENNLPLPTLDETEQILLHLHSELTAFYTIYNPKNVDEDVLTILMQFFIDIGDDELNEKLKKKYGADLNDFRRIQEEQNFPPPPNPKLSMPPPPNNPPDIESTLPPPPPLNITPSNKPSNDMMARTIDRAKRKKVESEYGINLPPPASMEDSGPMARFMSAEVAKSLPRTMSKRNVDDEELTQYKEEMERQSMSLGEDERNSFAAALESQLQEAEKTDGDGEEESEEKESVEENDDLLKLSCLDEPFGEDDLEPRDYIEAFYSSHDPSKLDREDGIQKFVRWVNKYSLEELSSKLEAKYGEGLYDFTKLAVRRKNLEKILTDFYLEHDRPKLDTRWTILKILAWTFQHGLPALNKKFDTRYGLPVVQL